MNNPIDKYLKRRNMERRMKFLREETLSVRRAIEEKEAAEAITAAVAKEEAVKAEETAKAPIVYSDNFRRCIGLEGAEELYDVIREHNYGSLAKNMGHMTEDREFLAAMVVLDKCEEYGDYEAMIKAFLVFEHVVRYHKKSSPVIVFARRYIIEMREYLTQLELL